MTPSEKNVIASPEEAPQAVSEPLEGKAGEEQREPGPAAQTTPAPQAQPSPRHGETLVQSLLSIIVIVLFVITFIVQAFQIPSESMENTLLIGDYLLVDKLHFGQGGLSSWFLPYRPIQRGDIIVFHYPVDPAQHFVKRVIGVPGDHILLRDKTVFVNDVPQDESYAIRVRGDRDSYRDNFPSARDASGQVDGRWHSTMHNYLQDGELVVPQDEYFVMGDNRDHSLDSRYWGFVPRGNVEGRPLLIYLSVREGQDETAGGGDDRLFGSGHPVTHMWQFARWKRMFHLVR
jgi:signal peptidase I